MRLDRRLYSAVSFPADYGFVAGTEGADGYEGRQAALRELKAARDQAGQSASD